MSEILKYGATAKWLHWLIGLIVIIMLTMQADVQSILETFQEHRRRLGLQEAMIAFGGGPTTDNIMAVEGWSIVRVMARCNQV